MAEVFLKQDGTVLIKNATIEITVNPSGLLEIISTGNTEITSAKTIFNNDVDIIGTLNATNVNAATSLIVNSKEMDDHRHSQGVDSDGDSQVNTDGPV